MDRKQGVEKMEREFLMIFPPFIVEVVISTPITNFVLLL